MSRHGGAGLSARLSLVVAAFVAAFALLALAVNRIIDRVKVNGPIYDEIVLAKDLVADVLPPPGYIIEAYLVSLQLPDSVDGPQRGELLVRSARLRREFEERHRVWVRTLPAGELRTAMSEGAYRPALEFFEIRDARLLPSVIAGDRDDARRILRDELAPRYEAHRVAVDHIVALANAMADRAEASARSRIDDARPLIWSLGVGTVAVVLALGWAFYRIAGSLTGQLEAAADEHRGYTQALGALVGDRRLESGRAEDAFAAIGEVGARGVGVQHAAVELREASASASNARSLADGAVLDAPIRYRDQQVGVVRLERDDPARAWTAGAHAFAASLADLAGRALSAEDRRRQQAELADAYHLLGLLHRKLESAKEIERRHLARELHDELGQALTALRIRLRMSGEQGASGALVDDAVAVVDAMLVRVRKLALDLRPALLDEAGLVPAVRAFLESHAALATTEIALAAPDLEERLPAELETAAFRVIQESVTNTIRHAGARRITVTLAREDAQLDVRVSDDGAGFDVDDALPAAARRGHLGVAGMRERVRLLGGRFRVTSTPGIGTEVHAIIPLTAPA